MKGLRINRIKALAEEYPYPDLYELPNSNAVA